MSQSIVCAARNATWVSRMWMVAWLAGVSLVGLAVVGCDGGSGTIDLPDGTGDGSSQVAKPVFSPSADAAKTADGTPITITCATAGAKIYYTTDDTEPDETSTLYTGPVALSGSAALQARAYKDGLTPSAIAAELYESGTFGLGLLALDPTQYNSIPLATLPSMGTLPASVDMSAKFPTAGNQGSQGSCVAWATAYAMKTYQENVENNWGTTTAEHQFSPAYVYNQIKVSTCASGSYIADAFSLLTSQGCATLSAMPYNAADCSLQPSDSIKVQAANYKISTWRRVNVQDVTEMKTHLAAGMPIVIGFRVYSNFYNVRGTTVYDRIEGSWVGNHAVCIVGYDDSVNAFKILNSWGTSWGDAGYFRMTYDLTKQLTFEGYVSQDSVARDYTLTVTSQGTGSGTVNPIVGTHTYRSGSVVTLTATPATNSLFYRWTGASTSTESTITLTIDGDKSVCAEFISANVAPVADAKKVQITPNKASNITLTASDADGDTLTYSIVSTPAHGQLVTSTMPVVGFVPDNGFTGVDSFKFRVSDGVLTSEATVTLFIGVEIQYTLTTSYLGKGTLSPAVGMHTYQTGTLVVVTATPAEGYVFDHWEGSVTGTNASINVTINSDVTARAVFTKAPVALTVTVSPADTGTVQLIPSGGSYTPGTYVTLKAVAATGYAFSKWQGGASGTNATLVVQVNAAMSVEAVFAKGNPTVSLLDSRTRVPYVVHFDMRLRDAAGHAISDSITPDSFRVYENGALLDYSETSQFITQGQALPMKVMLVLDYTNSMAQAGAIDDMIVAANEFIDAEHEGDPVFTATHRLGIIEFHDRLAQGVGYDKVADLTRMDASGKATLSAAIPAENTLESGLSRVWDAVKLGIDTLCTSTSEAGEARAVVFLTDGRDTTSTTTTSWIISACKSNNIALYPIGFGDVSTTEATLKNLASQTGGVYYPAASAASLEAVFAQIAHDLCGQWSLTYITQKNAGTVNVRVEFSQEGTDDFTYSFNAATLAGDIHRGVVNVVDRTYDAGTNRTTFVLKAEYMPRKITCMRFVLGHNNAILTLQNEGGLCSEWSIVDQTATDIEIRGSELQYGAFGNIGKISVPGNVASLAISHDDDNAVFQSIFATYGVHKSIVMEGAFRTAP